MNAHARKWMSMLSALSLLASLVLLAALRPAQAAAELPPALSEASAVAAPEAQAADAQAQSRNLADQAYDDTPVVPAVPWWPARSAPTWPQPTPRHGAGTDPRPRLRPPSA